jgi:hypothetical protein
VNASTASTTARARGSNCSPWIVKKTRHVDLPTSWVPRPIYSAARACDNVD